MKTLHRTIFAVMAIAALAVGADASTTAGANANSPKKRPAVFSPLSAALSAFTLLPPQPPPHQLPSAMMSPFTLLPEQPTRALPAVATTRGQASINTP